MDEFKHYSHLYAALVAGTVRLDGSAFVATASDGVEVDIGHVTMPASANTYLASHPTPDMW